MKRNIYVESTPLDEALELWAARLAKEGLNKPLAAEKIKVIDSIGRVTAGAVMAAVSSPFYHSAAMDGYAVRFPDTFGASETSPVRLNLEEQAVYLDTGDPMPEGFNAVIMVEDINLVTQENSELVEIIEPATPWQHVRTIGEDIVATELIVPENHCIRSVDIGALLAGGHTEIMVRTKPMVAIIPTGSELIEPGAELGRGTIIEYNSRVLGGLVSEWGGEPLRLNIVQDDLGKLKASIAEACDKADVVIVNAGSSAGSEDYTAQAIREQGELMVHGIGIRPGKPVILGIVKGKPVLGIPGYPVSAYITFNLFAKPLIYAMLGMEPVGPEKIKAILSRQIASSLGLEEFVRVKVGVVGEKTIATPVSRGAGIIMSLVRADGMLRVPSMSEGIGPGTVVDVELMRPLCDIRDTLVCIGSHDNTLDLLSNFIKKSHPGFSLSSAHVGSMGGLIALKKGEAHMAGTHLLDEDTGDYNIPFLKRLMPEKRIALINLVYRQQGFVVKKGNPKNIRGFEDLVRDDVTFINRQGGSGTRLLTDKHLKDMKIDPSHINGYYSDEYTHMGVASAVLSGIADTGVAILAAARALDMDFVAVARERYDLAIPLDFMGLEMIKALLKVIREDKGFRAAVLDLGGYDTREMGNIMYEG